MISLDEHTHPTLRFAGLNDIDDILKMGMELYKGSSFEHFTADMKKAREQLEKFIISGQKDFLVILSHDEGQPVGVLAAYAFAPLFSQDKAAVEVLWYLAPDYRDSKRGVEMMNAFEYWAKMIGCKSVQYGILTTSPQGMHKLYEKRGCRLTEYVYHKDL